MSARPPYSGTTRKLVLAFDVGTTFSGISYSILDPGEIPEIRGVTRFPAQEQVGGDSKIPTILYYDKEGKPCAIGAEAAREGIEDEAEDAGWTKAEWQLHLRPKAKSSAHVTHRIPPLPPGKSAIDIFADFLRYLHRCARTYIEETHANGVQLWHGLEARTEFVLTHPNGWEGAQQGQMRTAAVKAGLIPDTEAGHARLSFVTEGEASLHFCIQSGLTNEAIKRGKGLLIVDAGGGTIDISAYRQTSPTTQSFEEIAAPMCDFHGSIFVTSQAKKYLENLLGDTRFAGDIPHIERCFDKTTKLRFRGAGEPQFIKFGTLRDKDPKLNIRSGQLKLLGSDVATFFEPSVNYMIKSIEEQCNVSTTGISSVFLVGGFAASDWLFTNLKNTFGPKGLDVSRPDSHVNKAVADGAVSFFIDHFVAARVSKLAYGTEIYTAYQPRNPDHFARVHKKFISPMGIDCIAEQFSTILPKVLTSRLDALCIAHALAQDTKVMETQEFRKNYHQHASEKRVLENVRVPIMCYRGLNKNPLWMDTESGMFSTLCYVDADTTALCASPPIRTQGGTRYYSVTFDIVLSLGLTELKAHICWKENGVEKKSRAEVIYEPPSETVD
ncbi:hypothetical protein B0H34DRAFT_673485 [Crassisporium funariophilum]|nr:hypothetical protein B0H34DRAFT_673485 [Crassisporium funariophilum]